ncbi:hypothetical protein SCAR479_03187 [Seiridium cardinale]|uniref:Uncharacterized protein n=1 Tax=Seiridium cardinale TaxID=138064 RepID=A0ABR2Y1Z0_9PEZI
MSTAYTTSNQGLETRGSEKREETAASRIRTDHASEDVNMYFREELRHPTEAQRPKKRRYSDIEPITNVWVDYKGERWVEGWAEKAAKQESIRDPTKSSWHKDGNTQGKGSLEDPYIGWVPQPDWADPESFIYIGEDNVLEQIAAHESIVRQVCRHIKCASAVIRKELHTTTLRGSVISRDKPHLTVEFGLTKERADWNAHLEVSFQEVEPQNIQGKRKPKPVMLQGDKPYMPIERIKNLIPTSLLGLENISDVLHRVREELRPIKKLNKRKTRPSNVDMTDNQPQLKQPVWIDFDFQIDNYGLNLDYRTMYDDIFIPKTLHIQESRSKSTSPSHKPAQGASSSRAPKSKWDEDRYYRYSYQEHDRTLKSRSQDRRRPFNSGLLDERNRSRHHGRFQPRSSVALGRGDYYRPGGDSMHDTYIPNYSHHELPIRKRSRLDDRR